MKISSLSYALICLLVVACGGGEEDDPDLIKVGAIFDLTGPTSDVGSLFAEGLQDYVRWTNEQGGIEGRPVELVFQDYGYKIDVAEQLYSQFVQEGVVAFMGWGTGDTEALRGRVAQDKMPPSLQRRTRMSSEIRRRRPTTFSSVRATATSSPSFSTGSRRPTKGTARPR